MAWCFGCAGRWWRFGSGQYAPCESDDGGLVELWHEPYCCVDDSGVGADEDSAAVVFDAVEDDLGGAFGGGHEQLFEFAFGAGFVAAASVEKHVRAWEKPSDHVPAVAELRLN